MIIPLLFKLAQLKNCKSGLRYIPKLVLLGIILLYPARSVFAQTHSNYNLLWRISGKNLTKPSYLFGTMHVKDKRVFDFSDSVMLAIQKCPSFALETHPDTIVKKMFLNMGDEGGKRSVRSMLSKEDYDKLSARFKKKNGYPMGDIDAVQAESMLQPEREKADDKATFIDAYLFGVARSLGKSVYGLEDAALHLKDYYGDNSPQLKAKITGLLEDDDEDEQLDYLDELITAYSTGNLDNIVEMLGEEKLNDSILIARNNVMVKSMLTAMETQPLFTAVGVAHLPGNNGIIALLRKLGYTLTPVTATFTGVAKKFNTDYTKLTWQTFTDESRGYSMELPFTPIQTDAVLGMNTVVFPDIVHDITFGAYAILEATNGNLQAEKKALAALLKRVRSHSGNRIISNKQITVNGLKVNDITVATGSKGGLRYRIIFNGSMMYYFYAGNTLANLNQSYANRFFNSIKIFKPITQRGKGWVTLKNDTAAFQVNMPGTAQSVEKMLPGRTGDFNPSLKLYMAIDSVKLENYLTRYNDYPAGMYLASPEKAFTAIIDEYKTKGIKIKSIKNIDKDGNEGRDIIFLLNGYSCRLQLYARGNRLYMLLKQTLSPGAPMSMDDDFFTSFKFMPYLKTTLNDYELANGNFKGKIFNGMKLVKDSIASYRSFTYPNGITYSVNPTSGAAYGIEHATISRYYRAKNVDSVYASLLSAYIDNETDTLQKLDTIKVNGLEGREYITRSKTGTVTRRHRIFIVNENIFHLMGHQAKQEMNGEADNAFYNSLVKVHETTPINLPSSKAQLIMDDLADPDSITHVMALGALNFYEFQKDELPYIYTAIKKPMQDDSLEYGSRGRLIMTLRTVNDSNTIAELKQLYLNTETPVNLKGTILSTIAQVNKYGYGIYLSLLKNHELVSEDLYEAFKPLSDSLEYVKANYEAIAPILKNNRYRRAVLSVFNRMLYSYQNGKYNEFIKTHFDELTAYANDDLDNYLTKKDNTGNKWSSPVYHYLQMMKSVKGKALTAPFTARLLKADSLEGNLGDAVTVRLRNNLPVPQQLISRILDSADYRYNLLKELNSAKQLSRAPAKYRTQPAIAKLSFTQYINDSDEGTAENVTLLGTLPEKGNLYYVYKFKTSDYEESEYVGVCGPYKAGSTVFDFKSYYSYSDWEEKQNNWQKQAKKMIPELKKATADELKD